MKKSLRLVVIVVLMGLLADCADKGPAEPDYTDALTGAALESAAAKDYWAADYFTPLDAQRYGLRTFEVTVGEPETFTSSIVGTHTVPYQTGAKTGTILWFWNDPMLLHVDGRTLSQLNDDGYYLSTDCDLTDFPSERVMGRITDGMILDQRGDVWRVHPSDPDDCIPGTEDSGVWLIQIRDVNVGGKKYNDAILMWDLEPGSDHKTLDFYGKDEELGITGPSSDETNGWAIDGWAIVGFRQGIIAVGDFWVDSGELDEFAELVSIEPLGEPVIPAACPTEADFVVTDEDELLDALARAEPGAVIGLDGYFGITSALYIETDDITLTCATPGSGLYVEPGWFVEDFILVPAKRAIVDRLILDASGTTYYAYYAGNDGAWWRAEDVQFTNNTVTCGPSGCAFFPGVAGAIITDNYFEAPGSATGIHLQGQGPLDEDGWPERRTDGSRVERNTIVATAPQPSCGFCGGIRPRDGRNLVVSHNTVEGPWLNSISTAMLYDSEISSNRLEGAQWNGIALSRNRTSDFSTVNNVFRGNRVNGAGFPGVRVLYACDNVFDGNNLKFNNLDGIEIPGIDDIGMWLGPYSGANIVLGNKNVIVDDGDYDCDGDFLSDPNIIAGSGRLMRGIDLADNATEATSSHGKLK
jgi:hypothetical protein